MTSSTPVDALPEAAGRVVVGQMVHRLRRRRWIGAFDHSPCGQPDSWVNFWQALDEVFRTDRVVDRLVAWIRSQRCYKFRLYPPSTLPDGPEAYVIDHVSGLALHVALAPGPEGRDGLIFTMAGDR